MEKQTVPGKNTSVWIDTTQQTQFPKLEDDITVDVAIIGGGISGLSAAYFLAKAGLKVAVLETGRIVEGTTGFTTAKITSAHGLIYKYLIDKFGIEKATIYAHANQTALEKMVGLMAQLDIDADLKRLPAYTYTISDNNVEAIQQEVQSAKKLGLPVSYVTDSPLPYQIKGAIKYENQACYHPRKYLLRLAKEIIKLDGLIFEETKISNITEGNPCKITADKAQITAKQVVIATNYPIYDPDDYFARLTARQSLVLAVELNKPVPQGLFYSTEESFHSLRPQRLEDLGKEVLLVGGELFKTGQGGNIEQGYMRLIDWANKTFDVKSVLYHWTTNDSQSQDRVPLIGKLKSDSKNLYVAAGFSGWGMTHGTVAGIIISDLITGKPNPWTELYEPTRLSNLISVESLKSNLNAIEKLVIGRIKKEPKQITLQNGEAGIFEYDDKKIALYKDEKGELHSISAVCTHMGCIVAWNNAEKTWDCPCHGSRFRIDGTVIHGPAAKNLEKVNLDQ